MLRNVQKRLQGMWLNEVPTALHQRHAGPTNRFLEPMLNTGAMSAL